MFSEKSATKWLLVSLASGKSAVAHFLVADLVPTRQHCPGWVRILVIAASGELPGWITEGALFSEVLPGWITEGALSVGVVGKGLSPREINSPTRRHCFASGRHALSCSDRPSSSLVCLCYAIFLLSYRSGEIARSSFPLVRAATPVV